MLKLGYFEHWSQPKLKFVEWAKTQGVEFEKIDYSQKYYLDKFDVVLIEQNGFNDYIENDEDYIHDWIRRGGIMFFMAQDYKRWAPYFLPEEAGYTQIIHRYVGAMAGCKPYLDEDNTRWKTYMMPWIEECGRKLFAVPNEITADEMIDWRLKVNTFTEDPIEGREPGIDIISASVCCMLPDKQWDVLGSYMDPAVRDGALIAKCNCGKGMVFVSQLLFPEVLEEKNERCLSFWKKYLPNLLAYFERFKAGESEEMPPKSTTLPIKRIYKMCSHMHSLDWYGCDSQPGTINAMMRWKGFDICSIAIKYTAPYGGKLNVSKYCDDKVLFLNGQEYHPFNWNDMYANRSHNTYHMLSIGVDDDAYTSKFTRSVFNDDEVNEYLKEAVKYVHDNNGVVCSAHAYGYYFDRNVGYDAMDQEPFKSLAGSNAERFWLEGGKTALMSSIDLFGFRRMLHYPTFTFIYLEGKVPSRDTVCEAIRKRHTIGATHFDEADITLGDYLPGDEVTVEEAKTLPLNIKAKIGKGELSELRVYSAEKVIYSQKLSGTEIDLSLSLKDYELSKFVRVEIQGSHELYFCASTPFFFNSL